MGRWVRRSPLTAAVLVAALLQVALLAWPDAALATSSLGVFAGTGVAAVATGRRARRERRARGAARRAWQLAGVATGFWCLGRLLYLPDEIFHGRPLEHPAPADVPVFIAYALAACVALAMPWGSRSWANRLRALLDSVMFASSVLGLAWVLAVADLYGREGGGRYGPLALAYPMVALVLMSVALIVAGRRPRGDALATLCLALATVAGTMTAKVLLELRGVHLGPAGLDGAMMLAALLFAVASTRPLIVSDGPGPDGASRAARALPYLPIGLLLVAEAWLQARGEPMPSVLVWCGIVAIACMVARQSITIEVNAALTRKLRQQRGELAHLALHDSLTGAGNRVLLYRRLSAVLAEPARSVAVLVVDLDGFKNINDTYGHAAGDAVLVVVSGRLASAAGDRGLLARLGGDEFVVVLPDVTEADALAVADDILTRLRATVGIRGITLHVRASVGVAVAPSGDSTDPDTLLQHGDLALYEAKAAGKDCARVFATGSQIAAADRLRLDTELRDALDRGEFELFYQPIVDLSRSEQVVGFEALLRWRHPRHGLLTPARFLDRAEAVKLMPALTRWTLREACRQAAQWETMVNVNVSASQALDPALAGHVAEALAGSALPPDWLTLEVTEHAVLADLPAAATRLAAVKRLGVRLALDDFGTGYSSVTHLSQLPIDAIKIDKSFVDGVADPDSPPIAHALLQVAGTLGLTAVAEGVERPEQAQRLAELGCRFAQGYMFSRPVGAEAVKSLLKGYAGATMTT